LFTPLHQGSGAQIESSLGESDRGGLTVVAAGHTSSSCACGSGAGVLLQRSVGDTALSIGNRAVSILRFTGHDWATSDGRESCEPNDSGENCGEWNMHVGYLAENMLFWGLFGDGAKRKGRSSTSERI